MNKQIPIIIQREFMKLVRRKSFWISTFALPVILLIIFGISVATGSDLEASWEERLDEAETVLIVDEAEIIDSELLEEPLRRSNDRNAAMEQFRSEAADALIIYPDNFQNERNITVFEQDSGLLNNTSYQGLAEELLRESVLSRVANQDETALISGDVAIDVQRFDGSQPLPDPLEKAGSYVIPGLLALVYFLLILLSANYFIMSVAEEKENRVAEMVFTAVKPVHVIMGKLAGLSGVALLQAAANIGLLFIVLLIASANLPVETAGAAPEDIRQFDIEINPGQIILGIFYLVAGFLILATTMIGVGAIMPSAQEAGSLTGVFLLLAISPLWFMANILANPNGLLAVVASYFPYTAPLILLIRNTLGELGMGEIILSIGTMSIYVIAISYLAVRLFQLGAMEYHQKLSLKRVWQRR